jgi:hypothetical protein
LRIRGEPVVRLAAASMSWLAMSFGS